MRLATSAVAVVVGVWYALVQRHLMTDGDFQAHFEYTQALLDGAPRVPHVAYHAVLAAAIIAGVPQLTAQFVIVVASQIAAAVAALWFIAREGPATRAVVLAVAIMLVGPILPQVDSLWMIGHFLPNGLHNPTAIFAKPFVPWLLVLGAGAAGLIPPMRTGTAAALVAVSGLTKPHFVSCLVPASLVLAAGNLPRVPWKHLMWGLVAPGLLIVVWTVVGTALLGQSAGTPAIAPLAVLKLYAPVDAISIVRRLISDLAFPLVVVLLWPAAVARFAPLVVAWVVFAFALMQALLLAETGPRLVDGNFLFAGPLATFGLMVASAAVLARQPVRTWRSFVAWTVLGLHVWFGVIWVLGRISQA